MKIFFKKNLSRLTTYSKRLYRFLYEFYLKQKYFRFLKTLFSQKYLSDSPILIDGSFDNPNYWYRIFFILSSLKIDPTSCTGILGEYRRFFQRLAFRQLGVKHLLSFNLRDRHKPHAQATLALANIKSDQDLLKYNFPHAFPGRLAYDFILKRQRQATINFADPNLIKYLNDIFNTLKLTNEFLEKNNQFQYFLSSHAVGWQSCLVWLCLERGIKVIIPIGDVGLQKFWMLKDHGDIFNAMDCLKFEHLKYLSTGSKEKLIELGHKLVEERFAGKFRSIGPQYAYQKKHAAINKREICKAFCWDINKPIIGVYASNWFDFPHSFGMENFANFHDWITSTLSIAKQRTDINWIFKGHPVDEWYKGIKLEDLIKLDQHSHIHFADVNWNGQDLIKALTGIVTCHGTIGIEATCLGVPVLTADKGWYETMGFTISASDRNNYLNKLKENWWEEISIDVAANKAFLFAGAYWGKPTWQKKLIIGDDPEGMSLLNENLKVLSGINDELNLEKELFLKWLQSDITHFGTYKTIQDLEKL